MNHRGISLVALADNSIINRGLGTSYSLPYTLYYRDMQTLSIILVALVALEHLYILWIEMFAWTSKGREVFRGTLPDELFEKTKGLAANQGLYNGFLAAGLLWGLSVSDPIWSVRLQLFFLGCVLTAALYGALRSSPSILLKQGLPAALALLSLLLS